MGMTDINIVNTVLGNLLRTTGTVTWSASGAGGTNLTILPPLHLHLFSVTGTETGTGTEYPVTSVGYTSGYPAGGMTMGSPAFTALSVGTTANTIAETWTATGTWTSAVNGIEVWDDSSTAVRILWGPLTTAIGASVVVSGDTVSFIAGAITVNGSAW
jgi:hypothetical protein